MLLYPTEGHRFANDIEDITVYVNGKEASIERMSTGYVLVKYVFPELEYIRYDLWVGGTQANEINKEDILGNGIAAYDPSANTLTLKGGTINGQGVSNDGTTGFGAGIYSKVDGLIINVVNNGSTIVNSAKDCHGIYLKGNTTISGDGLLIVQGGSTGVYMGSNSSNLTVGNHVTLFATGAENGESYGIAGYMNKIYYSTLTVKDNADVKAYGASSSIGNLNGFVLENHAISSPTGAIWNADKHAVCNATGNPIAGEWVTIAVAAYNRADVNRDGAVDSADIVAVIKEMPDGDKKADVNGDGAIDSADIVAVIKAMK